MKCPVCKSSTGGYYWEPVQRDDEKEELVKRGLLDPKELLTEWHDNILYQREYPGDLGYLSPRCLKCYDKAVKKAERKQVRRKSNG
ncbi:hypothetical protein LCGC14_1146990 [marine sediment metagenome]|uniref:Uncharacterized protein n=1 Tax=marine sediment metagenome TaxID=412755 RepID=A0A0F9PER2_9ZZZZ